MGFKRKNIRLPRTAYIGRNWYFLTTCTHNRSPVFDDADLVKDHLAFLAEVAKGPCFAVQAYCFLPDHLHLLVSGESDDSDCMSFINLFKQKSGFAFKRLDGKRLWQHKSYDHILRPGESWVAIAYYIWMNPVRKALCAEPQDWPYSGSQTLDWQRLLTTPEKLWIPPWKKRKT